jgi:ABC-type xylose transport system substrate-binding protein
MATLKPLAAEGKGNVAVLLPDTVSSARYTEFDAPYLTQALTAAGLTSSQFSVQNAQGSDATELSQAQAAITKGASVLIMDPFTPGGGAAIGSPWAAAARTTSASTTSSSAQRSARVSRPVPPPGASRSRTCWS